jgi:opacity protein-like surface antigen
MTKYHKLGLAAAIAMMLGSTALAADVSPLVMPQTAPEDSTEDWSFSASPYFWAAGLSGKTSQFGLPTIKIDSSFSDIFQNLDFAFMGAAELRHERFSVIGDFMYIKLSADADTPFGLLTKEVDVQSETVTGLLGVGYAVLDGDRGHLDVVGGIRVWSVDTTISLNGGFLDGRSTSDGATWVDGMAGFRGKYDLTEEWFISGWGLVGTGGANVDWDVAANIGYQFNDTISAVAGYRALGVNYRDDGFVFDTVQQGPILGVTVKF